MNIGIEVDDFGVLPEVESHTPEVVYNKLTIQGILSVFKSGIGLDIAKNHTGVCLWRDGKVETTGFYVDMDYDKTSYMAEAKMRLQFKKQLAELLSGYNWEVCVIEDVYGGANFDTTRKLLALNCVIDELALEGIVQIDNLYRLKEAEWMKSLRTVYSLGTRLNPKYECQAILEFLEFPFYLENASKSEAEKKRIFFEDRCDATGQLLALAIKLSSIDGSTKSSSVKMSGLYFEFLEDEDDMYWSEDSVLRNAPVTVVDFPESGNIEESILEMVEENKDTVLMMKVSTDKLGTFGIVNGFKFYEQGYGFLVCYEKGLRKQYK